MKKNIACISQSISFVTGNFLFFMRMLSPMMLVTALFIAIPILLSYQMVNGTDFTVVAIMVPCYVIALLSFLFQQGAVFAMWDVKQRGLAVDAQKPKSVYSAAGRQLKKCFTPKRWIKVCKYYFSHFKEMFSLTVCCVALFGGVSLVICLPMLAIVVIENAIAESVMQGDAVQLPTGFDWNVFMVMFVVTFLVCVILLPAFLSFQLRKQECDKEDAELKGIMKH